MPKPRVNEVMPTESDAAVFPKLVTAFADAGKATVQLPPARPAHTPPLNVYSPSATVNDDFALNAVATLKKVAKVSETGTGPPSGMLMLTGTKWLSLRLRTLSTEVCPSRRRRIPAAPLILIPALSSDPFLNDSTHLMRGACSATNPAAVAPMSFLT